MICSFFFLLVSLTISGSCYQCQSSAPINPTTNQTFYYPTSWSGVGPIPQLDRNQNCYVPVNVPSGYFANVTFYRNFPYHGGCYVGYSNNKVVDIENNDNHPFIFTAPRFDAVFQTTNATGVTEFAFKIEWIKFPTNLDSKTIDVWQGNAPVAVVPNANLTTFRTAPRSTMTLIPFSLMDPTQNYLLRQSMLFDGTTLNSKFIGTLGQVLSSNHVLNSKTRYLSVYTFGLNSIIDYPLFMGQDSDDNAEWNSCVGKTCPSTGDCEVTLFGNFGSSLTITDYNGTEYITGFNWGFPPSDKLNVYENRVGSTAMIVSLNSNNYHKKLPLAVKGTMKFYELIGSGELHMTINRGSSVFH